MIRDRRPIALIALLIALWGCRQVRLPTEGAPRLVTDVSFRKIWPADTLVLGPTRELLLPDMAKKAPLIDGILDDPCWRQSARAGDFVLRRGDVAELAKNLDPKAETKDYPALLGLKFNDEGDCLATCQTEARLCYDRNAIYAAFDCADTEIVANARQPGNAVLDDDCVEMVLNTHRNVFHLAINPKGVAYASRVISATGAPVGPDQWHPALTLAMHQDEKSWQCEVAIPFPSLEIKSPTDGSFCGVNLGRRNHPAVKHPQYEMEEVSTWSASGYSILEPRSEGVMFFRTGPPVMIAYLDPGKPGFGYNRAVVGLRNRTDAEAKFQVRLITFGADGAIIESTAQDLVLSGKEQKMITLNYCVPWESTSCFLDASLFTFEPEALIGHQEVPLELPKQPISVELDKREYAKGSPRARGRAELGVGELRMGRAKVTLDVSCDKGNVSHDEIPRPESRFMDFSLNIKDLSPGTYTLTAELRENAQPRGNATAVFEITR